MDGRAVPVAVLLPVGCVSTPPAAMHFSLEGADVHRARAFPVFAGVMTDAGDSFRPPAAREPV